MFPRFPLPKPSHPITPQNVLVLAGGWSLEREVSLSSGKGVAEALEKLGHMVEVLDPPKRLSEMLSRIENSFGQRGPSIIFNILHGHDGEDGVIQGVLNLLGIPYTFSGVLGSSLSMHKGAAREIVASNGVRCPEGKIIAMGHYLESISFFPHVCKPLGEGSTVGVQLINSLEEQQQVLENWTYGNEMLIEHYIPGREIQVAVFGGVAMGAVEIRFQGPIFSYEAKYVPGHPAHLIPAPIHAEAYDKVLRMAEIAHQALHCRGVTRSDFRYDDTRGEPGTLFYLETNPQPGLTPLSLVPDIAASLEGWTYEDVVQWILEDAMCPK